MLGKTVKYTDYDGNEREETFHFNLSKAELAEMELSEDGGLVKTIERITAAQSSKELVALFKKVLLQAYGEKSPDGKRFIKNQELRDAFSQTEAYSIIFMEVATDAEKAAAFIHAIVPSTK